MLEEFKDIKLIVADVDMTLKINTSKNLPHINVEALNSLHEKGYKILLASGRNYEQLLASKKHWNLKYDVDGYIAVNGSSIYDNNLKIKEDLLLISQDTLSDIDGFLESINLNSSIYRNEYTLFRHVDERFIKYSFDIDRDIRVAKNKSEYIDGAAYKVLCIVDDNKIDEFKKICKPLLEKHNNEIKLIRTNIGCLEFVHKDASKFYGLSKYCKRYNIPLTSVMSFGDSENDEEMLAGAAIGVCLKNGSNHTKNIAKYITDLECEQGGFGDFVFKNLLN